MGKNQSKLPFKNTNVAEKYEVWRNCDADSYHQFDKYRFIEFAIAAIDANEKVDLTEIERTTSWSYVIDEDRLAEYQSLYEHIELVYGFFKEKEFLRKN